MTTMFALGRKPQTAYEAECLDRHWTGVTAMAIERARTGTNTVCVDCGGVPMGGGLRCVGCYGTVARPKSVRYAERGAA